MEIENKDLGESSAPKRPSFIRRHKKLFTVLSVFVLIIATFGILMYFGSSEQRKITHDFFEKLEKEEYSKAYEMTSEEFQESISEKDLQSFAESRNFNGGVEVDIDGVEMEKESEKASRTNISGQIELEDDICDFELEMIKKDDDWKIYGLDLYDCEKK